MEGSVGTGVVINPVEAFVGNIKEIDFRDFLTGVLVEYIEIMPYLFFVKFHIAKIFVDEQNVVLVTERIVFEFIIVEKPRLKLVGVDVIIASLEPYLICQKEVSGSHFLFTQRALTQKGSGFQVDDSDRNPCTHQYGGFTINQLYVPDTIEKFTCLFPSSFTGIRIIAA